MSKIKVIRKASGQLFRNTDGRVVFVKEGVNFAMNDNELKQIMVLANGILNGSMEHVNIPEQALVKGD